MTQYTSLFKAAEELGIPHNQLSKALAPREQWLKQEARREVARQIFEELEQECPHWPFLPITKNGCAICHEALKARWLDEANATTENSK